LYRDRSGLLTKKNIFSLCFLLLIFINQYGLASSMGDIASGDRNPTQSIIDFVDKIYHRYSEEDFEFIYEKLHPALKEIISEKDYIEFQEENFRKYKLEIGKIKVGTEILEAELPDKFIDIINIKEEVYTIKVSYEMKFETAGINQDHENDKDVLVVMEDEKIYLLWDPSVVND